MRKRWYVECFSDAPWFGNARPTPLRPLGQFPPLGEGASATTFSSRERPNPRLAKAPPSSSFAEHPRGPGRLRPEGRSFLPSPVGFAFGEVTGEGRKARSKEANCSSSLNVCGSGFWIIRTASACFWRRNWTFKAGIEYFFFLLNEKNSLPNEKCIIMC